MAGLAAAAAWWLGINLVFGPAQRWLADPDLQSAKFLAIFGEIEPLPHMAQSGWVLPLGLFVVGVSFAVAYAIVSPGLRGGWIRRASIFGLVSWLVMVPWFEFYLPWNVMHEPWPLVALEMGLWAVVLQVVALAVALMFRATPQTGGRADRA